MKNISQALFFLLASFLWISCEGGLMTRGDVKEIENKRQMQDQVVQKTTADASNRFSEIDADLRSLNGRIEVMENKLSQSNQDKDRGRETSEQKISEQARKTQILQDELIKTQEQLAQLIADVAALRTSNGTGMQSPAVKKDNFEIGEDFFDKKEWRRAILSYQKYRDANPKSKRFPEATYKIGVSFQELGLKDEARTFFDEVIAKFPQSSVNKRARTRLKSLKK